MEEELFINCPKCLAEYPGNVSREEWARLSVGLSPKGRLTVRCVRHGDLVLLSTNNLQETAALFVAAGCSMPDCKDHHHGH